MESSNKKLIQAWLDLQCSMVQGTLRGAVIVGNGGLGATDPVAVWPPGTMLTAPMVLTAKQALIEQRSVVETMAMVAGSDITHGSDVIAAPLMIENRTVGAVVFEITARMKQRQDAALQVVSWGSIWLQSIIEHLNAGPTLRLNIVVETIAEAVKYESFGAATAAVASALGRLFECNRVSIGFCQSSDITIEAISNTARFERRTNLVRAVGAAMMEAVDQDQRISLPNSDKASLAVARAHEHHINEFGSREVHTLPFSDATALAGAIMLERSDEQLLTADDITLAEAVISIIGPILATKRQAQLPLVQRTTGALGREMHRFTEPGHLSFKAGVALLALLFVLGLVTRVDYELKADATLIGQVQRAVIAPFDGYIAEAPLRAGDVVAAGRVMARLDDRDLKLERKQSAGEQARLSKSRREALAMHDRAKLTILRAELDEAEAGLALANEKLARADVTAPIDGIVVSGDLSQSLGAPVKRGDLLFEVAPLDKYRIVLKVDERDIASVRVGQHGRLALASLPHLKVPFIVDRIVPTSSAENGQNFFVVEALLSKPAATLRPGMAGVGKIDAGQRPLAWIWSHRLSDRLRLMLWQWWG